MSASSDLYIKSVSHVATAESVIQFFNQADLEGLPAPSSEANQLTAADDIKRVDFLTYPGAANLRYCRVSFNTSAGVTSGMKLNGLMLSGVPTRMSVVDPSLEQLPDPTQESSRKLAAATHTSETSLVQQELEELRRTVCFRNIPPSWTDLRVSAFVSDVLGIDSSLDLRVDRSVDGESFALVLFQAADAVARALSLSDDALCIPVEDSHMYRIRVEPAQSVVRVKDPNIQFGVDLPSLPPVPIAYQSVKQLSINKKVEQARARIAQAMSRKSAGDTPADESYDDDQARKEIARLEPEYLKAHSKRRWPPASEMDRPRRRRRYSPPPSARREDDYPMRRADPRDDYRRGGANSRRSPQSSPGRRARYEDEQWRGPPPVERSRGWRRRRDSREDERPRSNGDNEWERRNNWPPPPREPTEDCLERRRSRDYVY